METKNNEREETMAARSIMEVREAMEVGGVMEAGEKMPNRKNAIIPFYALFPAFCVPQYYSLLPTLYPLKRLYFTNYKSIIKGGENMRKGFTLVEILVVIGIIGLLAVFLVPNLLGARDRGKEAAVKGVMHTVQLAIEAYQMENDVYPMGSNLALESLCNNYLMAGGYMAAVPKNPFTGQLYTDGDLAGKIIYNYDNATGGYTLIGYKKNGIAKLLELTNM